MVELFRIVVFGMKALCACSCFNSYGCAGGFDQGRPIAKFMLTCCQIFAILTGLTLRTLFTGFTFFTLRTLLTGFAFFTLRTLLTASFYAERSPGSAVIVGNLPIAVCNAEQGSDTVFTILTILTILTVNAILTVFTVSAIGNYKSKLCSGSVCNFVSINKTFGRNLLDLRDANSISTIFTVFAIYAVFSVSAVLSVLGKSGNPGIYLADPPVSVFTDERGKSVLAVNTVFSICAIFSRLSIFSVFSANAIEPFLIILRSLSVAFRILNVKLVDSSESFVVFVCRRINREQYFARRKRKNRNSHQNREQNAQNTFFHLFSPFYQVKSCIKI